MKCVIIAFILGVAVLMILAGCTGATGNTGLKIGLCGDYEERYTTSEKGCENIEQCKCIHNNFFNACDNCECTRKVNDC